MKEASQPLELLVLEPEKNRLTLELNQKKSQSKLKCGLTLFFLKIGNPDLIVVSFETKKKIGEE